MRALAFLLLLAPAWSVFDPVVADPRDVALGNALVGKNASFGIQPGAHAPPGHEPDASYMPQAPADMPSPTREEVMKCAMSWAQQRVAYCQCNGPVECCGTCPHCATTRCDCSGFVSYCWGFRVGYTTRTIPQIAERITKSQLRKGDVMLYEADHVVFFGGWTDASNSTYLAVQEPGCHTVGPHYAFAQSTVYPFNWMPQMFVPYRYKNIRD
jgi:hypothetical protein